ncbi:TetR/AcrR family transcriptional regulator [Agitococcus lubricus]|uniref:TetR family transcriptional regulator n=1 Tax=Agitococcus lubricus TaxID=1077255 RepID=A0A2T5J294_9GAMM|nr:TetR/AcrR family transcriptional regulator [Agitococcus lubricus]PTQ90453.1 TetR family transcriptional regulator [Agitococcus lubricus]
MQDSDEMSTKVPKKSTKRGYGGRSAEQLAEERYQRLMASALELFGTVGYLPTTVEKLCAHAKVTPRHFYEHFADREAILIAVFKLILQETRMAVLHAMLDEKIALEQRLLAGMNAFLQAHLDDIRRVRITTQEILGVSQRVEAVRNEAITEFAVLIENYLAIWVAQQKIPARNYRVLAFGLVGAMHELQIAWLNQQVPQERGLLLAEMAFILQAMMRGVQFS